MKRPSLTKKQAFLFGGLALVVLGITAYAIGKKNPHTVQPTATPTVTTPVPSASAAPTPTPTPSLVPSKLDGAMVGPGRENLHPLAVMIENHPDARPQSGLGEASLVYEAIAEGGITRFMAVYADPAEPVRVGPVRSARTYFVDLATELNAFYAHAGGNRDALDQIGATGVFDEDGLVLGSPMFVRDHSRPVATEHTLYSSTDKLWNYATVQKNWPKAGSFQSWLFRDDAAAADRPAAQKVSVNVSSSPYSVSWQYDQASNSYLRFMAGSPHIDADTGKQIAVKNVVTEQVQRRPTVTKIGEEGWIYTLTGSGPATVSQNGLTVKGTWKKEGSGRTRYYDADGKEIAFVRGPIWVHLVHPDSSVTY